MTVSWQEVAANADFGTTSDPLLVVVIVGVVVVVLELLEEPVVDFLDDDVPAADKPSDCSATSGSDNFSALVMSGTFSFLVIIIGNVVLCWLPFVVAVVAGLVVVVECGAVAP